MTEKTETPPQMFKDEMNAVDKINFQNRWGDAAYERLPWSRPATAAPARDGKGRFHTKKRSEMTVPEKAEFIDKYGVERFNALPYD